MNRDSIKNNIEKHGWQFQYVFDENGEKAEFSYSIGFEESFGHPEIMIFGLKRETMHTLLSNLAYDLKNGATFQPNVKTKGVLSGEFEAVFKPLKDSQLSNYAGVAARYYEKPFRVLVMLWPDKNNIQPTEKSCELTVQAEALDLV